MFDDETQERIDRFMKVRVNEGLKIDPETAEVDFSGLTGGPVRNCPYDANFGKLHREMLFRACSWK